MALLSVVGGGATLPTSSPAPDQALQHGGNMGSTLPSSLTTAASLAPKPPTPAYHGPSINSIHQTASQLGATTNSANGVVTVNGQPVTVTSILNGHPFGPVHEVAAAAGYPGTHVQTNSDGTVQVMPHVSTTPPAQPLVHTGNMGVPNPAPAQYTPPIVTPPSTGPNQALVHPGNMGVPNPQPTPPDQALVHPGNMAPPPLAGVSSPNTMQASTGAPTSSAGQPQLNGYWQGVQKAGGLYQAPNPGQSQQDFINQLAQKFGLQPGQIQINANGHAFIPFSAIAGYAQAQSLGNPTAGAAGAGTGTGATGKTDWNQLTQMFTTWLQNQMSNPYQYQLPTQPAYNWDPNAAAQQAYQMENPIYQNQIAAQNQTINDQMNKRGIYNSGLAQQAVDSADATIYNNMDNAIQKDIQAAQTAYNTSYNDQISAWRDQVTAMYQQGQLSDTQARDMLNAINDYATQANKADATQAGLTKAEIPYTQGATPQQLTVDSLNQYKAQVDAAYKSGQLTEAQYRDETTRINDAMKNAVAQQNANTNTQKANTTAQNDQATQNYHQQQLQLAQQKQTFDQHIQSAKLDLATQTLAEKYWQSLLPYNSMTAKDKATLAINEAKVAIAQQNANTNASKAKTAATQGQEKINLTAQKNTTTAKQGQEKINISQQNANTAKGRLGVAQQNASTASSRASEQARHNKATESIQQQNATTAASNSTERKLNQEGLTTDPRTGKIVPTITASNNLTKQQQTAWNNYATKTTTELNDQIQQARQVIAGAAVNSGSYSSAEVQAAHNTISTAMQGLQNLTVAPVSPQVAQYAQQHPGSSVAQLNQAWQEAQQVQGKSSSGSTKTPTTSKPPAKKK